LACANGFKNHALALMQQSQMGKIAIEFTDESLNSRKVLWRLLHSLILPDKIQSGISKQQLAIKN
jgi:hypothetical protein